jgi:copper chaperone
MSEMSQDTQIFTVTGMTCGHCELSVREEVEELDGVSSATADRASGRLTVVGDVDPDAVRKAVETAGYTLAS